MILLAELYHTVSVVLTYNALSTGCVSIADVRQIKSIRRHHKRLIRLLSLVGRVLSLRKFLLLLLLATLLSLTATAFAFLEGLILFGAFRVVVPMSQLAAFGTRHLFL